MPRSLSVEAKQQRMPLAATFLAFSRAHHVTTPRGEKKRAALSNQWPAGGRSVPSHATTTRVAGCYGPSDPCMAIANSNVLTLHTHTTAAAVVNCSGPAVPLATSTAHRAAVFRHLILIEPEAVEPGELLMFLINCVEGVAEA